MKSRLHCLRLWKAAASASVAVLLTSSPAWAGMNFKYDRDSRIHGTLHARYLNQYGQYTGTEGTQRAGSGSTTDACQKNYGWIPDGWYNLKSPGHIHHFAGSAIQGRIWRLSDKACHTGVLRTELFIHTEETSSNGQSCPTGGDDPFCWEGENDYYSNGCIKLSHGGGMPYMNSLWDSWDGRHDFYAYDKLYVAG